MRKVTLCFLLKDDSVCLAMKKVGFGAGKWNGVGGKVEKGESIEAATVREAAEEIQVEVKTHDLEKVSVIQFSFEDNPDWSQEMHVFLSRKWKGSPQETDEMAPQWYSTEEVPYTEMWVDDPYWLPQVLSGKKVRGSFHFTNDGDEIKNHTLEEVEEL